MKNKISSGETMYYTAPAGGVLSGVGYLIGALFVVAAKDAAAAAQFAGETEGVFQFTKAANEGAWVEGAPVYWDVANTRCSIDPTVGLPIGTVANAALTADVVGNVRLNGSSLAGRTFTVRKSIAIATLNAGAVNLIPALPGLRIRVHDYLALAEGGAAAAVTTVDVIGTQGAAGVKLATFAQASLTQSTVLRPGIAGTTVLADGASFKPNDLNTAVQASKTGAAITTATFIDFELIYSIEP